MRRLEFLDSLRGIAALFVILIHVPLILTPNLPIPSTVKPMIMYGWTGVELFFVISAFSLCLTMPRHESYGNPIASYTIARVFRIVPLFYILIIYNAIYGWYIYRSFPSIEKIIMNMTFTFNLFPRNSWGLVGAGWTVSAEMLFYLVFPILYKRFPTLSQRIGCALMMLVLSKILLHMFLPYISNEKIRSDYADLSVITHFPTFVLGMIAFSLYNSLRDHRYNSQIGLLMLTSGAFLLSVLVGNPYAFSIVTPPQAPSFAYLLILVGLGLFPWQVLVNRVTQFYGRISYSTYLWHPPVIFLLEPSLHRVYRFGLGDGISLMICYGLVFASVTVVAELSYHCIELPGMRLGKYIKARLVSAHLSQSQTVPS